MYYQNSCRLISLSINFAKFSGFSAAPIGGGLPVLIYWSISSLLNVLKHASKQREFPVWPLSGHFFPCCGRLALFEGLQAKQWLEIAQRIVDLLQIRVKNTASHLCTVTIYLSWSYSGNYLEWKLILCHLEKRWLIQEQKQKWCSLKRSD